jgi:hypothetical protein
VGRRSATAEEDQEKFKPMEYERIYREISKGVKYEKITEICQLHQMNMDDEFLFPPMGITPNYSTSPSCWLKAKSHG